MAQKRCTVYVTRQNFQTDRSVWVLRVLRSALNFIELWLRQISQSSQLRSNRDSKMVRTANMLIGFMANYVSELSLYSEATPTSHSWLSFHLTINVNDPFQMFTLLLGFAYYQVDGNNVKYFGFSRLASLYLVARFFPFSATMCVVWLWLVASYIDTNRR